MQTCVSLIDWWAFSNGQQISLSIIFTISTDHGAIIAQATWKLCDNLSLSAPFASTWIPDSHQGWGRWRWWERGVTLHLGSTVASTSWLSNSYFPTRHWLREQPLRCLTCETVWQFHFICAFSVWMIESLSKYIFEFDKVISQLSCQQNVKGCPLINVRVG